MQLFKDHVFLCNNVAEYVNAIDTALAEDNIEKQHNRINFAQSHSWRNNVEAIYARINQSLN
jgi:teichuronic acid biosynthesis glycosyltransferase TuaH